jgi:hypothetical protein
VKIVIYNSHSQYALSRAEIEAIRNVLPTVCWAGIEQLHIARSDSEHCESFEFDSKRKTAYLIIPVLVKTATSRTEAIRSLLIGLARIKGGSRFFLPLKTCELLKYEEFVSHWAPSCEAALARLHEDA